MLLCTSIIDVPFSRHIAMISIFFFFLSNKDLGEVKRSLANAIKRLNNVFGFEFFSFVNQSRSERKEENGLKMGNWKAIIEFED